MIGLPIYSNKKCGTCVVDMLPERDFIDSKQKCCNNREYEKQYKKPP